MNKNNLYCLIILVLCFLPGVVFSNIAETDIPILTEDDIPGGVISKTIYYDGSSLYGYINGGADLYLEYGFKRVLVQEISWHEQNFKIEVYRMNDSIAAFGVYSIMRYNCAENKSLCKFDCVTPYHIQAAKGPFYISVINEAGTDEVQQLSLDLAKILISKSEFEDLFLPGMFKLDIIKNNNKDIKYINGRIGLQNGYPGWLKLFGDLRNYRAYLLPVKISGAKIVIAQIDFNTVEDRSLFLENCGLSYLPKGDILRIEEDEVIREAWKTGESGLVFIESKGDQFIGNDYFEEIDKYINNQKITAVL